MAMAIGDDMMDGSVTPRRLNSIDTKESGGVLSPEDVAWADSCLIKDLGILDNGLDALRNALPKFPSKKIFSAITWNDSLSECDMMIFPTIKEPEISGILDVTVDDVSSTNEQGEVDSISRLINNEDGNSFWSKINSENVFLHTYNEDRRLSVISDSEAASDCPTIVEEQFFEDIFKVWELNIPDEEDELVQQLNKALGESSLEPTPTIPDVYGTQDEKLLDLISGIADLSLSPNSD